MSFPYINAFQQFFDTSGAPLVSGTIEFRDPTTDNLINSYPTADDADAQTNANANPLTLNASGAAATGLFLEDGVSYKVIVKDAAGATVKSDDNVRCPVALPYLQSAAELAASVTPTNVEYPVGDLRRYGDTSTLGDGTTDNTTAFTNMIKFAGNKFIPKPTSKYKVDQLSFTGLSDVHIDIEPGTIIEANSGFGSTDQLFELVGCNNISINAPGGATCQMLTADRTGEAQAVFVIYNSTDIYINGITAKDCGGDGFDIGLRDTFAERVYITNCVSDNAYRNGVSVTSGRDIYFVNHIARNASGTSPQGGYDVEPNADLVATTELAGTLENINFINCEAYDNVGRDFGVQLTAKTWPSDFKCDVKFSNCTSYGDKAAAGTGDAGFYVGGGVDEQGIISFTNCHSFDARTNGIEFDSVRTPIVWLGGSVHNPNQAGGSTTRNSSAVSLLAVSGTDGSTYGNTTIDNLHVTDDDGNMTKTINIQTVSESSSVFQNLNISVNAHGIAATKRTYNQGGTRAAPINIRYTDDPQYDITATATTTTTHQFVNQKITNTGASGTVRVDCDDATSQYIGNWFELQVAAAQTFTFRTDAGNEILPGSNVNWSSNTIGDKLRVKWDGSNWQITNQIGTWS